MLYSTTLHRHNTRKEAAMKETWKDTNTEKTMEKKFCASENIQTLRNRGWVFRPAVQDAQQY